MSEQSKELAAVAENALIEWSGQGIKHIATPAGNATLLPGAVTPVATAVWAIARPWLESLIVKSLDAVSEVDKKHGRIVEHFLKAETVEVPEKKGPGGKVIEDAHNETKIVIAKDLGDLSDSDARAIIGKIVDPAILEGYLASEALDGKGLKDAIERRIKAIAEKGAGKGKK